MQQLYPTPSGTADLAQVYAYPRGRPWLRANMVSSADGAAWRDGRAGGLGNEADRRLLSLLRGLADVIIVGAQTVRVEGYGPVNPRESWAVLRAGRSPVPSIAVVSRCLDLDFDAPLFTEATAPTIVITAESSPADRRRLAEKRAEVIIAGSDQCDLGLAVDALIARGHTRLLTEGGPRVLAQLTAAGRLDELCLTVSPLLLAGDAARILDGQPLPEPQALRLAHLLEDEGYLFLRYTAHEGTRQD